MFTLTLLVLAKPCPVGNYMNKININTDTLSYNDTEIDEKTLVR